MTVTGEEMLSYEEFGSNDALLFQVSSGGILLRSQSYVRQVRGENVWFGAKRKAKCGKGGQKQNFCLEIDRLADWPVTACDAWLCSSDRDVGSFWRRFAGGAAMRYY